MKKSAVSLATIYSLLCITSCHRPHALYQPIPTETFRSSRSDLSIPSSPFSVALTDMAMANEPLVLPKERFPLQTIYASTVSTPPIRTQRLIAQRILPSASASIPITYTGPSSDAINLPQPGPKTKERKTLREFLGLKPRKKLNWWQRIHWSLKASMIVTLFAVGFALLQINVLAIIFGVLGALLLVRGLKKTFKVRRPLF